MYPENPEETRVILGCVNMGYDIYPTLPGFGTHNLFRHKRASIPLDHSRLLLIIGLKSTNTWFGYSEVCGNG